jgi:hypothetical protein
MTIYNFLSEKYGVVIDPGNLWLIIRHMPTEDGVIIGHGEDIDMLSIRAIYVDNPRNGRSYITYFHNKGILSPTDTDEDDVYNLMEALVENNDWNMITFLVSEYKMSELLSKEKMRDLKRLLRRSGDRRAIYVIETLAN